MEHTETAQEHVEPEAVEPGADGGEQQAELNLAIAELAFWLDFAKWWRRKYCNQEEPRIAELLAQAEQRYLQAKSGANARENVHDLAIPASPGDPGVESVD